MYVRTDPETFKFEFSLYPVEDPILLRFGFLYGCAEYM